MQIQPYRNWPLRHRRLLQVTLALLVLFLFAFWTRIFPRWKFLNKLEQDLAQERSTLKRHDYPMDATALKEHLDTCLRQLEGTRQKGGLIQVADETLKYATSTFHEDIIKAYPTESYARTTSEEIFIRNATRIDYKDLYDRVSSEFQAENISFNPKTFGLEDDSPEPPYQMMIKLWTVRKMVALALKHHLKIEEGEPSGSAYLRILPVIAYTLGKSSDKPYLLEFPIRMKVGGTMEDFLQFIGELQTDEVYLPLKALEIHSTPPADLPPGEERLVDQLHFSIVCSSFFRASQTSRPRTRMGGVKSN